MQTYARGSASRRVKTGQKKRQNEWVCEGVPADQLLIYQLLIYQQLSGVSSSNTPYISTGVPTVHVVQGEMRTVTPWPGVARPHRTHSGTYSQNTAAHSHVEL